MPTRLRVIWSIFKRNFGAYFISPTGYVFITVFIALGAMAAFWHPAFFLNNLANLDQLNAWFPVLLLFFVPALTMNVWAEERRVGTDELLLTLPARDSDVVLGKYFAVLGIYTVAILFSLSHVIILAWLGDPDLGLVFSTYLGYWLSGAALLAVGMVASLLTSNATVAFIIGALLCGALVYVDMVNDLFGDWLSSAVAAMSIRTHFTPFGDGLMPLSSIFYFIVVAIIGLYANVALLKRRHFAGGPKSSLRTAHYAVRATALIAAALGLFWIIGATGAAADATAEDLHTLQPQTRDIIDAIPEDRPVFIQAFFSPDVPEGYVPVRKNLINTLNRVDDLGGDRIKVVIHDTEPYTDLATTAAESYNIIAAPVMDASGSQRSIADVFLGMVFTSGPEEFVIPFFDVGLPVEYEIARSIRVVSQAERKTLGIVGTDAKLFGEFDFQTMAQRPGWAFVEELKKQYEVKQVSAAGPYPDDLDVLLAVLPSSMTEPEITTLTGAVMSGTPTIIFDDPMPIFNLGLSPTLPKDANRNPFTSQGQPPAPPKGNLDNLLRQLGLRWTKDQVLWTQFNPHPGIRETAPPEIIFIIESPDNPNPFNEDSPITSGLQEVVMLGPGSVMSGPAPQGSTLTATPLLRTGSEGGATPWNNLVQRSLFGMQFDPRARRLATDAAYVTAMHVKGDVGGTGEGPVATTPINAIFIADVDMISETFFQLRRQGAAFNFDNVTFALNCIDELAGDESFIALRKHRPRHRTLTRVEGLSQTYADARQIEIDAAEAEATEQLQQAQQRLNEKVAAVQARTDIDDQAKTVMLRNLQEVENRRLQVIEANIQQEKDKRLAIARGEMETGIAGIQRNIKWWAALLPPVPPLILAIAMYVYRRQRERMGVSERRLVGQPA